MKKNLDLKSACLQADQVNKTVDGFNLCAFCGICLACIPESAAATLALVTGLN